MLQDCVFLVYNLCPCFACVFFWIMSDMYLLRVSHPCSLMQRACILFHFLIQRWLRFYHATRWVFSEIVGCLSLIVFFLWFLISGSFSMSWGFVCCFCLILVFQGVAIDCFWVLRLFSSRSGFRGKSWFAFWQYRFYIILMFVILYRFRFLVAHPRVYLRGGGSWRWSCSSLVRGALPPHPPRRGGGERRLVKNPRGDPSIAGSQHSARRCERKSATVRVLETSGKVAPRHLRRASRIARPATPRNHTEPRGALRKGKLGELQIESGILQSPWPAFCFLGSVARPRWLRLFAISAFVVGR